MNSILTQINEVQKILDDTIDIKGYDLQNRDIIFISEALDELINIYYIKLIRDRE